MNSKPFHHGLYVLPNIFTTACLLSGVIAIIQAIGGNFAFSAGAIFLAMLFDGLDGRVARLTHTQSHFGAEYDSLADMIAFGLAPALLMYQWLPDPLQHVGLLATAGYTVGAALRLARFNTQIATQDKQYFTGLASPSAAALVASTVGALHGTPLNLPSNTGLVAAALTVTAGLLMISNFRYLSFKGGRFPVLWATCIVLLAGSVMAVSKDFFLGTLTLFLIYALSGPVTTAWRLTQQAQPSAPEA